MLTNIRRLVLALPLVAVVALLGAPQASAAAMRTWVSGVGDDVNPCSRTAPCKTWAGTISKTAPAGAINSLDPGGFGTVTITKSMTIDGYGAESSALNSATNGIIINGANIDVVLRNISIHGGGVSDPLPAAPACGFWGLNGVRILNARSVRMENVRISTQSASGVLVAPAAGANIDVSLDGVDITDVCGTGVQAASTGTGRANVHVHDSSITSTATGMSIGAGITAWLSNSTLFGNSLGVSTVDGGTLTSEIGNVLVGNGMPGTFSSMVNIASPVTVNPTPVTVNSTVQTIVTPVPLVVALADTKLTGRSGRPLALHYAATTRAVARIDVRRGAAGVVASVVGKARKGSNVISWNGMINGKPAPAGTYQLTLQLDGEGDAATSVTASVRMSAAPRVAHSR